MENRTVLFVDDEIAILHSLKRLLRAEPYQLSFARSGQEALSILEKKGIHVIVTDLGMPGMDGMALLKQVQARYPDVIRLVLSGQADIDSILAAINRGNVYRYITKPWNSMELRIGIKQAIDLCNLHQERRDLLKKLEEYNLLLKKRVEERTRQLLAIEKQAEIGKYASQIVHNLHNPLQAIRGSLDFARLMLSDKNPDLKKLGNYFNIIQSGISDLEKITAGILVHVKDEALFKAQRIDINTAIKRELEFFKLNTIFNQIEKVLNLSDNLPRIPGDPIHFKQIIDNLVGNAIDAMEHSPEKRLSIMTYLEDNTVCVRVSDTGEGIYKNHLERIFSPDFSSKPIGKGTGLGLASVKTMVDAYSGTIQVESKRGEGTTFIVGIPAQRSIFKNGKQATYTKTMCGIGKLRYQ
jgi:two-component system sensor histidine kinase/response regulator